MTTKNVFLLAVLAPLLFAVVPASAQTGGLAQNCLMIKAANPSAVDGHYIIAPLGRVFVVYCHDMAADTKEYLTLVNTGGAFNYSQFGGESLHPPANTVTTHFERVRLDPLTLLVDIADRTFASSVGSDCCIGPYVITSMEYARAADCLAPGSDRGRANVDLTGLPFVVDDTFFVNGFVPRGSSNGQYGTALTVLASIVNLTGGGFCGEIVPRPFSPPSNGFDLQLKYTGDVTLDKNTCKDQGWRAFGVFKNQGDCVSFFATAGNNQPALNP
jgi:hypothetical protein